jgi:hypothetical protein
MRAAESFGGLRTGMAAPGERRIAAEAEFSVLA